MAQWGNCNFSELLSLRNNVAKAARESEAFEKACLKELAGRLLSLVIRETPKGKYKKSTGKQGGTLQRGWTAKTQEEAESGKAPKAKEYAESLSIKKVANMIQIEIINPVDYASYVEYGHRIAGDKGGWVQGSFMLTLSEAKLRQMQPQVLNRLLKKHLEGAFRGN